MSKFDDIEYIDILGDGVLRETYKKVPTSSMSNDELVRIRKHLGIYLDRLPKLRGPKDGDVQVNIIGTVVS